jgi:soluble lytic murein transglycosylase
MALRRKSQTITVGRVLALALVLGALGSTGVVYLRWLFREQRYNRIIEETAAKYGVDKFLIKAVIHHESEFDPFAYGHAGEIGLMQVTPAAGSDWARATGRRDFGRDLLWDARANIEAGTWYLSRALRRWQDKDDPVPFALAEYNAGLGNVLRWLPRGTGTTAEEFMQAITYPTVRDYIATVTDYRQQYQAAGNL